MFPTCEASPTSTLFSLANCFVTLLTKHLKNVSNLSSSSILNQLTGNDFMFSIIHDLPVS